MTTFVVLEPDDWGMRWARPPATERLNDPEVFVHHSAGNPHHLIDADDAFRILNEYAITQKGYSAVDYDVLVHEDTRTDTVTIGVARGQWMSAATKDRNEQGEAVCALGYYHPGHQLSERPSPGMVEGVARAIALTVERGWVAKDAVIMGHRDNPAHPGATGCPGDYLYAHMDEIRARVAELLDPPTAPPPPEEDDVSYKFIDIDGYQDQFLVIPISHETKRRMGALGETPLTLKTDKSRQQLEAFFGYQLTLE